MSITQKRNVLLRQRPPHYNSK